MKRSSLAFWVFAIALFTMLCGCGSSRDSGDVQTQATTVAGALYVGSEVCATCHQSYYDDFIQSGHNFKLNKVENGQVPTYPFSTIAGKLELLTDSGDGTEQLADQRAGGTLVAGNAAETDNQLGTPVDYSDISYVIGGFGWKARWIDLDGYIVTGSGVQYNLEDGSFSAYHNDETNKPYNCGNCHTTGWKRYDASLNANRQDNLPGMDGTWVATGIQCESCHGAGAAHVASQDPNDISKVATARTTSDFLASDMGFSNAVACSECHTRDGEKDHPSYVSGFNSAFPASTIQEGGRIAVSGSLVRHHEQYDEMLGIDPDTGNNLGKHLAANVTCETCHDPHKTIKHQGAAGVSGLVKVCTDCHGAGKPFEVAIPSNSSMVSLDCEDCHMPLMVKNAISNPAVGTGPATGDIAVHIFKIDLAMDPDTDQFTTDGKYAYPWLTQKFACAPCHNGVDSFDLADTDLSDYTYHQSSLSLPTNTFAEDFATSARCSFCHDTIYNDFADSGHNFKLNKVMNNTVPTYPFSDIGPGLGLIADDNGETDNTLGTPLTYADISYVIGGFGWKARWIDLAGYIVTGSAVQYNLEDGSISAYHNDEVDKVYNCGNCHTTGWKHYDATDNPNRQDDLPGMDGTFEMTGIQCESCHGAGMRHVFTNSTNDITEIATARTTADFMMSDMANNLPVACSECHTRDGEKDYSTYVSGFNTAFPASTITEGGRIDASGSLTRHHEQYDEWLGLYPIGTGMVPIPTGVHATATPNPVTCIDCHNPHTTTKHQDDAGNVSSGPGVTINCAECHVAKTLRVSAHASFDCEECHMPKLVKNAINTDGTSDGTGVSGNIFGDIRTHIFKVDLAPGLSQFETDAGVDDPTGAGWTTPWVTSKFACGACHADYLAKAVTAVAAGGIH